MDGETELPTECSQHVLSFLTIQDCVRLGSASSAALQQVLPNLLERRNRMKIPYAIVKEPTIPTAPPSSPTSAMQDFGFFSKSANVADPLLPKSNEFGLLSDLQRVHPKEDLLVFPTVQDQVEELAIKMPSEHTHSCSVVALRNSLRLDLANAMAEAAHSDAPKASLVALLAEILTPLKLHAEVLKHALHHPVVWPRPNTTASQGSSSRPLHEYVGDVLAVTYLLNNDSTQFCSSVEGSPSQFRTGAPNSSYASWVLLHSGILRTKQFSEEQRKVLGIPDYHAVHCTKSDATRLTLTAQLYKQRMASWSVPMDRFRDEAFRGSELTLVYDDFGPLGPSFRGRDVVRIRQISAQCLLAYFSSPSQHGEAARVAVDWMCLAHSQATKTRPMTVRTPEIRL